VFLVASKDWNEHGLNRQDIKDRPTGGKSFIKKGGDYRKRKWV